MLDKLVTIEGKKLELTNLDKELFPGYTKLDLINYYDSMAEFILPYLKDRPISMKRYPDGISGENFFQKNIGQLKLPWLKTEKVLDEDGKTTEYLICNDKATLIFLANLAAIEIHPWLSKINNLNNPDFMLIDLDPEKIDFDKVIDVAKAAKKVFDKLTISSYLKTTGMTGLHILIPVGANYSFNQIRTFAEIIARMICNEIPEITSLERLPEKRQKKVYVDYLQNSKGQTMIVPYGVRANKSANVSAPIEWNDLNEKLRPKNFTLANIYKRVQKNGDPMRQIFNEKPIDIKKIIS